MTALPTDASWPPIDSDRVADAIEALAARVGDTTVRPQLYALASVVRNLGREAAVEERAMLDAALGDAVAAGDEAAVVKQMRDLAARDRSAVIPVDWSAASGA